MAAVTRRLLGKGVLAPGHCRRALSLTGGSASALSSTGGEPGKFFEISDEAFSRSFPGGISHAGLETLFLRLQRKCLFARQEAVVIIDALRTVGRAGGDGDDVGGAAGSTDSAMSANPGVTVAAAEGFVVIESEGGQRGVGKSAVLAHVVHWARSNGWMVLHIPSARELMEGGLWVQPSPYNEGYFDQPQVAQAILRELVKAHGPALERLRIDNPIAKGRFESATTYNDLVQIGLDDENEASQVVADLRAGLSVQTAENVLVAIDDFNLLYGATSYFYLGDEIPAEKLTLVNALRDMSIEGEFPSSRRLKNGMVVVAESNKYPRVEGSSSYRRLKRQCDHLRVMVPKFSSDEFSQCCDFFAANEVFNNDSPAARDLLKVHTQLNPAHVFRRIFLS